MCFNIEVTAVFATIGFLSTFYVYKKSNKNLWVALGVFYFFLMELLQVFQYIWIDKCHLWVNQFLTFLGWLHVCYQPFFCNLLIYSAFMRTDPGNRKVIKFMLRFAFLGGTAMLIRFFLGYFPMFRLENEDGWSYGYENGDNVNGALLGSDSTCGRSPEWLRGRDLCTFSGRIHLGWSIPLASSGYFVPGMFLHFAMMFFPFFIVEGFRYIKMYGAFLMLTGPILATFLSDDLMEQGSIWCFFSMSQVLLILAWAFNLDPDVDFSTPDAKVEEKKE